jgi:hypothetical protein
MTTLSPAQLIEHLRLEPLPIEGGYFRRTYLADEVIGREALPTRYTQAKALSSAIFFLLGPNDFSALHRLLSDEVYHFYLGDPVKLVLLYADGHSEIVELGQDVLAGQQVQWTVPHGVWQGSHLKVGGQVALLGTTLAPAYTQSDFELGERASLLKQYPTQADSIMALTREAR